MSLIRLSGSVSRLFRSTGLVRRYCAGPDKPAEDTRKDPNTEESKEDLHEEPVDELNQLYDAVLAQVPKHGWTDESISEAVKGLGWSIASTRMIQRGPVQVVEEFVNRCNKRLAVQLAERSGDTESSDREPSVDKAVYAIRERISMIEPFHDSWARALALQALPQNSPRALRASAMMVDEVAHYSGYREPNIAWYTDRAVLGLAYHATELYWLTDRSPAREDTWLFLERRLRDSDELRTRASTSYARFMAISDATFGSISSLIRSARGSY